jgi:hypothetical protein
MHVMVLHAAYQKSWLIFPLTLQACQQGHSDVVDVLLK